MRKNIVIVGCDYAWSRRIAGILAEMFDMRFFDMFDKFNFDISPNTLEDVVKSSGTEYVDQKMRGIFKSEFDFSGVVFVVDIKIITICEDLFDQIKENNIVLFLKRDFKYEYSQRENFVFKSETDKNYYTIPLDVLVDIEHKIEKKLANIVIDMDNLTYRQIKDNILKQIEELLN